MFVDHGFMRDNEPIFVAEAFREFNVSLICIDARNRFLKKLRNVTDPEKKRKIIGEEFVHVFE